MMDSMPCNSPINEQFKDDKVVIRGLINDFGLDVAIKYIGNLDGVVKFGYDNNLEEFAKDNNIKLVFISDGGLNMYIHDLVIKSLNLDSDKRFGKDEKLLGDFKWVSGGFPFKFTARVRPFISQTPPLSGQKLWRVLGTCGDHGFGYAFITKRDTIGKRGRAQIFKQIIEKFNLEKYMSL